MKERFKNVWTTLIGAIIMLLGVGMFFINSIIPSLSFSFTQSLTTVLLGWVFISAKDTLLEGLLLNFFKMNKPKEKDKNDSGNA